MKWLTKYKPLKWGDRLIIGNVDALHFEMREPSNCALERVLWSDEKKLHLVKYLSAAFETFHK